MRTFRFSLSLSFHPLFSIKPHAVMPLVFLFNSSDQLAASAMERKHFRLAARRLLLAQACLRWRGLSSTHVFRYALR